MRDPCRERRELEDLWRTQLKDARLRLDTAKNYANALNRKSSSASAFIYQQALRAESAALAEYLRVLSVFTHLVLDGTIPRENDWPHGKSA